MLTVHLLGFSMGCQVLDCEHLLLGLRLEDLTLGKHVVYVDEANKVSTARNTLRRSFQVMRA